MDTMVRWAALACVIASAGVLGACAGDAQIAGGPIRDYESEKFSIVHVDLLPGGEAGVALMGPSGKKPTLELRSLGESVVELALEGVNKSRTGNAPGEAIDVLRPGQDAALPGSTPGSIIIAPSATWTRKVNEGADLKIVNVGKSTAQLQFTVLGWTRLRVSQFPCGRQAKCGERVIFMEGDWPDPAKSASPMQPPATQGAAR